MLTASTSSWALSVGDSIPKLSLPTAEGKKINVNGYAKTQKKRNLLLVFFRTGTCGVCLHQLEEIAQNYAQIEAANATVLSLSLDDAMVQKTVSEKINHKFPVMLDPDAKTVNLFGTFNPQDKLSRPSLFLVGPDQKIVYSYIGQSLGDRPPLPKLMEMLTHYSGLLPTGRAVTAKPN